MNRALHSGVAQGNGCAISRATLAARMRALMDRWRPIGI
jgi:hypothetical protein